MSYLSKDGRRPLHISFRFAACPKGFKKWGTGPYKKNFNAVKASRRPPKFLCLLDRQSDSELTWYSPAAVCFCTAPQSCGTLLLHLHAAQRRRASEPSKWRPGPATSWPGRVARRAPRRMSDTSRKVTFSAQCRITHTDTVHKHISVSTLVAQWSARPCSLHEIVSSNPEVIHYFANSFFRGKHGK